MRLGTSYKQEMASSVFRDPSRGRVLVRDLLRVREGRNSERESDSQSASATAVVIVAAESHVLGEPRACSPWG